jgi:hypothetical protein
MIFPSLPSYLSEEPAVKRKAILDVLKLMLVMNCILRTGYQMTKLVTDGLSQRTEGIF